MAWALPRESGKGAREIDQTRNVARLLNNYVSRYCRVLVSLTPRR